MHQVELTNQIPALRRFYLDIEGDTFEMPRKALSTLPDTVEHLEIRLAVSQLFPTLDDMREQFVDVVGALTAMMIALPSSRLPRLKSALLSVSVVVNAEDADEARTSMSRTLGAWLYACATRGDMHCDVNIELGLAT